MYNSFDFINSPVFDTLKRLQTDMNTNSVLAELKRTIDSTNVLKDIIPRITSPFSEINEIKNIIPNYVTSLATYQPFITSLSPVLHNINNYYMPVLQQTKQFENLYNEPLRSVLQNSVSIKSVLSELNLPVIQSINESLSVSDMFSVDILNSIDFNEINALYENGDITDEDIAEEVRDIVNTQEFSLVETWDKIKKSKWFLAMRLVLVILAFLSYPVICEVKKDVLEAMGVYQFWEETGIYEWLNEFFGLDDKTVTEKDAKETVNSENIGNISKQKREDLLAKINEIRTFIAAAPQDENTGNLLTYLSDLEKDVNGKKYGLVFEEHREEIDEVLETHTPVLTEDKDLFIDNGGQMNFLIEGDNLAALKLLEKTHQGKIDLIYIDPPYNRGVDDFKYDDNFITKADRYIHSKWISFMSVRLTIARKLLAENGVAFISIDDNEQANLKLLCDNIFGEQCFAGMIPWRKRTAKTDVPFGISQDYEWILIYAKSDLFNAFTQRENNRKYYKTDDIPNREWRIHDLSKQTSAEERPNSYFTIVNPKTGEEYPANPNRTWAITEDTFPVYLSENRIVFPGDYDFLKITKPQMRYFKDEDEVKAIKRTGSKSGVSAATTQLPITVGMTKDGTSDLNKLFDTKSFPFPKPVDLIKYIIKMGTANKEKAAILDFFAGSGTTGQAVLRYNAENGGSFRQFILCTNNENNICRDVTYERIKRVVDKEDYAASLKYYKIDYVPIDERMYYEYADELLRHIRELVELENGINFNGNAEIAIVLTEEELGAFVDNIQNFAKCHKLYMGHDLLPTEEQQKAIYAQQIEVNIIPDYYYRDLQER